MRKFLILGFFLTGIVCHAQIKNFTINLGAGVPIISSVKSAQDMNSVPIPASTGYSYTVLKANLEQTFSDRRAFELRGQFDYGLTSKIFLTSGLSLNYIQFQRNVRIVDIERNFGETVTLYPPKSTEGLPFGTISFRDINGDIIVNQNLRDLTKSEDIGNTTAMSLQIPVLIGTSIFNDKLQVRLGPVFSYLLRATEIKPTYANGSFSESKVSSKDNFTEFNTGLSLQTTFLISPRFGVDFSAQKFLTPIYTEENLRKAKYNLLMFGVSYHFD
jgi:hypothetical protein